MIQLEEIRDFNYRILGYIETDTITGDKKAYDFYRKLLGTYYKQSNETRDFYQRIISRGDTLSALIIQADEKNKNNKK